MTQVAVLSGDAHLEEMLRSAGLRTARVGQGGLSEYARVSSAPTALVVDVRGQQQLPAGLATFRKLHGETRVVLVASSLEPGLMLEAMRAGVTEWIHEPLTAHGLEEAVRRVLVDAASGQIGEVLVFVGGKGGVGTTTLAVNVATALRHGSGEDVLLVDLHLGDGDAAIFLGVEPRFSVLDALENVHRVDESFFRGLVEKTKAGIDLLGSSERVPSSALDGRRVLTLLDFATRKYRFTVLDLPRSDLAILEVLEAAFAVVIVATQEVSAIRNAGRLAQALRVRYGASRIKTLVNRFDPKGEIAHADVERVIGDSIKHLIPSDYRVALEAMNTGRPVVLEQGRLSHAFRSLASDLGGFVKHTGERSAGMLGKLAFRRA